MPGQFVDVGNVARAHQLQRRIGVERVGCDHAVLITHMHDQVGLSVVSGSDLGAHDHRLAHRRVGSTYTMSLPRISPGGRRMAKMCRFQLLILSAPSASPGRARAANCSRVSSGNGVTKRRCVESGVVMAALYFAQTPYPAAERFQAARTSPNG